MKKLIWTLSLLLAVGLIPRGLKAHTGVLGSEFQVNFFTTGGQSSASVAVDQAGDFVVVWQSAGGASGSDTSGYGVVGRRFSRDGSPLGIDFQVNSFTTDYQGRPRVARGSNGDFVVVWMSTGSPGSDQDNRSIQGQRYSSGGAVLGGQFQVNSFTTGSQSHPSVAAGEEGDFLVVWGSEGSSGSDTWGFSVQGQRYMSDGQKLGGEFQVNTYTTKVQEWPTAAIGPAGDFVVVWNSQGDWGSDYQDFSLQGQRFSSNGVALASQFQVNTYITENQVNSAVDTDAAGGFVVVWESDGSSGSDSDSTSIQGQRYGSDGLPIGGEFQVNSYSTGYQRGLSVGIDDDGSFAVVWNSAGSSGSDNWAGSIQGQKYLSDGAPLGGEFQVNSYTTNNQSEAFLAMSGQGDFVVVWTSYGSSGSDTDDYGVVGQRYAGLHSIFSDGFESGDTSAWN